MKLWAIVVKEKGRRLRYAGVIPYLYQYKSLAKDQLREYQECLAHRGCIYTVVRVEIPDAKDALQ